jgi:hypothetical protein
MNRRLAVLFVAAALGIIAFACFDQSGAAGLLRVSSARSVVLQVGDTVRVRGTNIGCAVAKRQGVTVVECLEAVRRVGTYGTLMSDAQAIVIRFKSSAAAQTVFTAWHKNARYRVCR